MHDDPPSNGYSQTGTADLYLEDGSIGGFPPAKLIGAYSPLPAKFVDIFVARYVQDPFARITLTYQQIPNTWEPEKIVLSRSPTLLPDLELSVMRLARATFIRSRRPTARQSPIHGSRAVVRVFPYY